MAYRLGETNALVASHPYQYMAVNNVRTEPRNTLPSNNMQEQAQVLLNLQNIFNHLVSETFTEHRRFGGARKKKKSLCPNPDRTFGAIRVLNVHFFEYPIDGDQGQKDYTKKITSLLGPASVKEVEIANYDPPPPLSTREHESSCMFGAQGLFSFTLCLLIGLIYVFVSLSCPEVQEAAVHQRPDETQLLGYCVGT